MSSFPQRKVSIAPMMERTDRHDRFFLRLISKKVFLYTEMVTTGAILHGDRHRFLNYRREEHPIALQLGGNDPKELAICSKIAQDMGYDEVNLNVGCPSDRVQTGRIGACLMKEPDLVAECIEAMMQAVDIPITIKTRLGVDDQDEWEDLLDFVLKTHKAGCSFYIIHARKAWLKGLSPKQNRTIPPLNYNRVYDLKKEMPDLDIEINGGITSHLQIKTHLDHVDSVMIGREAYENPYILSEVDREYYDVQEPPLSRREIVENMVPYLEEENERGTPWHHMTVHLQGLFQGIPGARVWRRALTEKVREPKFKAIHLLQWIPEVN